MKRLVLLIINLGILAGILYLAVATNPDPQTHTDSITAKLSSLEKKDVLGQAFQMIHGSAAEEEEENPFRYHDYWICSKVTDLEGDMVSFGLFNRVFVTKNEL